VLVKTTVEPGNVSTLVIVEGACRTLACELRSDSRVFDATYFRLGSIADDGRGHSLVARHDAGWRSLRNCDSFCWASWRDGQLLKSVSRRGQMEDTWRSGHRCYGSCRERLDASYGRCWGCVSEVPKYCVSKREESERTPLGRGDLRAAVYAEMIVVVSSIVLYCVRVAAGRDTVENTVDGASV